MSILALNAGSSSLKFGLFSDDNCQRLLSGEVDWASGDRQQAQMIVRPRGGAAARSWLPLSDNSTAAASAIQATISLASANGADAIRAVGHRVVHGGVEFRSSARIDGRVKSAISRLCEVAPLHNPPALTGIEAAEGVLAGVPQVAVFDTAFFECLPPKAYLYPVPYDWYENWGIRRFGFHGISHAYCVRRAAELMGREVSGLRIINCHLGGGCSAAAVRGGMAVATTSGFSPLEGLMMGTRCGSIDPGIQLQLERQHGMTHKEMDRALNHASGLLGVSGVSADLAQIEASAKQGNQRAQLAFEMFADRVRAAVGALAATLGGIDALTFTDRIGEGSPALRAAVCQGLEFAGVRLDRERNERGVADTDIATPGSAVRVLVIHTEEELMVAREARRVAGEPS